MNRSLWIGVVSQDYRNTLERNKQIEKLSYEFMARTNAGECPVTVHAEWDIRMEGYDYIVGCFYFSIDAVTGERIEITRPSTRIGSWSQEDSYIINAYVDRVWRGDWSQLFTQEIDPEVARVFGSLAIQHAERHFINSAIAAAEFVGAATILNVDNNRAVNHEIQLTFQIIDNTGRDAMVFLCQNSRSLISITTMHNDLQLVEVDLTAWAVYEYELEEGGTAFRRVPVLEEDFFLIEDERAMREERPRIYPIE